MSALFPSKKAHITQKTSSRQTTSRPHDKKNPDIAISELFSTENPGICSRALRRRIRAISREDPPAPCAKQQEARGLHPNGSTFFFKKIHTTQRSHEALHPNGNIFFFKKVHTTRRSHEALHGFAQESTRTMLVPAWQDLKEQDEASRAQP